MTSDSDTRKLLARLAALHQKCDTYGPWRVELEPHNDRDGTTHYNHVVCTAHGVEGHPMTVSIGRDLTPALAELLVLAYNHLPELVKLARKGIGDEE